MKEKHGNHPCILVLKISTSEELDVSFLKGIILVGMKNKLENFWKVKRDICFYLRRRSAMSLGYTERLLVMHLCR